jgi:hypothetical protein
VGTIGITVGVILFIDKLEDLITPLVWSEEDWSRIFSPRLAELITEAMPPMSWVIPSSVIGMLLATLLVAGSISLLRRRRSGIRMCQWWSWLAILWVAVESTVAIRWLGRFFPRISEFAQSGWEGLAAMGVIVALIVVLAFPVFLLLWFSRPPVRAQYAAWSA